MWFIAKQKSKLRGRSELFTLDQARRNQQQNIKVSEDCSVAFAALAEAQGISRAALFEDMVAERLETLRRRGVKLAIGAGHE